eukprot:s28_g23.t1
MAGELQWMRWTLHGFESGNLSTARHQECQQLRGQLQDRRREDRESAGAGDEHSDAQSRSEISEERLAALQQQVERMMADGLRSSANGSDPGTRCQFRKGGSAGMISVNIFQEPSPEAYGSEHVCFGTCVLPSNLQED